MLLWSLTPGEAEQLSGISVIAIEQVPAGRANRSFRLYRATLRFTFNSMAYSLASVDRQGWQDLLVHAVVFIVISFFLALAEVHGDVVVRNIAIDCVGAWVVKRKVAVRTQANIGTKVRVAWFAAGGFAARLASSSVTFAIKTVGAGACRL